MRWKIYKELPKEMYERAEFHDNKIWLQRLYSIYEKRGRLFLIDLDKEQVMEAVPHHGNIMDFHIQLDGTIIAMTSYETADELWICRKKDWHFLSKIDSYMEIPPDFDESKIRPRSRLIKLFPWKSEIVILSVNSIIRYSINERKWNKVKLSEDIIIQNDMHTVITSSGIIFLGYDHGEFGGKLLKIDIETGSVEDLEWAVKFESSMEHITSDGKIEIWYNTYSFPVTGIIINPSDPDKIIYSLGLFHCYEDGGIFHLHEREKELILNFPAKQLKSSGRSFYAANYEKLFLSLKMEGTENLNLG